jgi:choline kinase
MKVVILAAGKGSRLYPITRDKPKALLLICGKPLIHHQIDTFKSEGFSPSDIIVVGGYRGEMISGLLPKGVKFLMNKNYRTTNNLYSLYLLRDHIDDTLYIVNGDLYFEPIILHRFLKNSFPNLGIVDLKKPVRKEAMKVIVSGEDIIKFGKDIGERDASGEYIGIAKFSGKGLSRLFEILEYKVNKGDVMDWYESAFNILAKEITIKAFPVEKNLWIDIDYPDDLERVNGILRMLNR